MSVGFGIDRQLNKDDQRQRDDIIFAISFPIDVEIMIQHEITASEFSRMVDHYFEMNDDKV